MWGTWVRSLGWEDLLEKEMAPHSSTLAWRIPWMEEPGRLKSMGSQRVRHDWATSRSLRSGISNFLEEISSLSHSVVFFYFFALITVESFLTFPCYLWTSVFKWVHLCFSLLLFASLLFTAICKASSDSHFAFLPFFSMGVVLIPVSCTMCDLINLLLNHSG